jgi:branched-chain amino acid aminotransferase
VSIRVYIDGKIHDERTAVVPVFDRGFLYGDSVYEVTRTVAGRPLDLDRHLDRLERSAAAIDMRVPPRVEIVDAIDQTLRVAANAESYLRVIATRGAGDIGLDPALADRPRLVVIVRPLALPTAEQIKNGVDVAIVSVRRNLRRALDPAVKSGNYLNNVLALAEARRTQRAHESIMCNAEGLLVEGSTSNIFVVNRGMVRTPALEDGLLDGITRRRVLELARAEGIECEETHLLPDALRGADEAFLTSSIRGVLPVVVVDGVPVRDGRPGPITRRVMQSYERYLAAAAGRGMSPP